MNRETVTDIKTKLSQERLEEIFSMPKIKEQLETMLSDESYANKVNFAAKSLVDKLVLLPEEAAQLEVQNMLKKELVQETIQTMVDTGQCLEDAMISLIAKEIKSLEIINSIENVLKAFSRGILMGR